MKTKHLRNGMILCMASMLFSCQKQALILDNTVSTGSVQSMDLSIPIQGSYDAGRVADWMGFVSDDTPISALTLPGTHDSGARIEPVAGTAKTQDLTLAQQLNAGVRFLDIRCRHYQDAFTIHHGAIYQNLNFDDVLQACKSFLASHPHETIVMSVKQEHTAEGNSRSFAEQFERYVQQAPSLWHQQPGIPALGDARGKIVLLRRFASAANWGMDASHSWADKATFTINNGNYSLRVQDQYQVSNNNSKWAAITSLWAEAAAGNYQTFYINFSSGYQQILWVVPNIPAVSNAINPQVNSFFASGAQGRYGAVVMDFIDAGLSANIVEANF